MPKPSKLSDFDAAFEQLLLRADRALSSGAEEFPIQFASQKLAHSLRFRVYAYFKALRTSGDRPDLAAMCSALSMRVTGSALIFYRRGEDMETAALQHALGIDKTAHVAPPSPLDSNLSQLNAIRARKKPLQND